MPVRPLRRASALSALLAVLLIVVLAVSETDASARSSHRTYRAWATMTATWTSSAAERATVSATASAAATVTGTTRVSATASASATVTAVGRATQRVSARTYGVGLSPASARSWARKRAYAAARARSYALARSLAISRGRAAATSAARAKATAQARSLALARATAEAARRRAALVTPTPNPTPTPTGPCGGTKLAKPDGQAWTCTFDDEFGGTTLNTGNWNVQTTAASGFTAGPTCFVNDPDNISVAGGVLALTVRKEPAPFTCQSSLGDFTTQYTGGTVNGFGKFSQTYGRFEVRAKLPSSTIAGLQETLWLWPVNPLKYGPWPGSGEIDFGEFYSSAPGWNIPYIHYNSTTAKGDWNTNSNVFTALPAPYAQPNTNCRIDQSGFNTYTVDWEPGQITLQVNGSNCIVDKYTADSLTGGAPFDQPFFMALTQGLGIGNNAFDPATTPLPATTQIDYVRIWQ